MIEVWIFIVPNIHVQLWISGSKHCLMHRRPAVHSPMHRIKFCRCHELPWVVENDGMATLTYPDHCQYCRCNSFPIESSNRVRPSLRCKHIYIRHRPECIDHDVNIHFRIQLYVHECVCVCPFVRLVGWSPTPWWWFEWNKKEVN